MTTEKPKLEKFKGASMNTSGNVLEGKRGVLELWVRRIRWV